MPSSQVWAWVPPVVISASTDPLITFEGLQAAPGWVNGLNPGGTVSWWVGWSGWSGEGSLNVWGGAGALWWWGDGWDYYQEWVYVNGWTWALVNEWTYGWWAGDWAFDYDTEWVYIQGWYWEFNWTYEDATGYYWGDNWAYNYWQYTGWSYWDNSSSWGWDYDAGTDQINFADSASSSGFTPA